MEVPSFGGYASGRALGKIAAMAANGGTWDGVEYITPEVWKQMHEPSYTNAQLCTSMVCSYTKGGHFVYESLEELASKCPPDAKKLIGANERIVNQGREGYYGWYGLGGCVAAHHPELKIGFGYVSQTLMSYDPCCLETRELMAVAK